MSVLLEVITYWSTSLLKITSRKDCLEGAVNLEVMGCGGGAKAKRAIDGGQRVVVYCTKCRLHTEM